MSNSSTVINLPPNVSQTLQSLAAQYGVDSNVIEAIVQVESKGNQNVVSSTGQIGIMQLKPSVFASLTNSSGRAFTDINDPQQNMEAGVVYFSSLLKLYGDYPTAIAAYVTNPATVADPGIPAFAAATVRQIAMLAQNAGSNSQNISAQNVQTQSNSNGQANSPAATSAQATSNRPNANEPVVTQLQIGDANDPQGLDETPWFDDQTLLTGNQRIRKSVQPVSFKIYLNQQTGELLRNPKSNKPIILQLNASVQTLEIQSKHVYNRQPSRTGQHITFWGMQPDLLQGTCTTGVFMNQFGLTDWFSVANVPDDIIQQVLRAFTTGAGKIPADSVDNLAIVNQPNFMRVAAQDAFVEFLKMFQMNGNVWFHTPNFAGYQTGQQQTSPTTWSKQTGLSALQQNARNNDVFSRGWVAMEFKNNVYLGYFKALNWNMDAEKPFQWTFNFTFQVERTFTALYFPAGTGFAAPETTPSIINDTLQEPPLTPISLRSTP